MANWQHYIYGVGTILKTFRPYEDSSAGNIHAIHAILAKHSCFDEFIWLDDMEDFMDTGDSVCDIEEADALLASMYDYADANLIWIE